MTWRERFWGIGSLSRQACLSWVMAQEKMHVPSRVYWATFKRVRNNTDFAQVADLWLEELPLVSSWKEVATKRQIIVIPYLLNDGQHGGWDIPEELGLPLDQPIHAQTHDVEGCQIRLTAALGTSPRFAEVIAQLAEIWGQTSGQ